MIDYIATLLLLIGLELVLGIDNILVISILVERLPEDRRNTARTAGLALAMLARLVMLSLVVALTQLTTPVIAGLSWRDIILIAGGLFLLWKAVTEIHHVVELKEHKQERHGGVKAAFAMVITQIVALDIVFSLDSVLTAVGLTDSIVVIAAAVVLSFAALLAFAKPVGDFILRHPALKILALSFLVTIGVTLFMEGLHQHVEKAYIYLPMGFALAVELLQMRRSHNVVQHQHVDDGVH